jgi:hypothetical protein
MPATVPRQPAWRAAQAPVRGQAIRIGVQSATCTESPIPARRCTGHRLGLGDVDRVAPRHAGCAFRAPARRAPSRRCPTRPKAGDDSRPRWRGSSPHFQPRFSESKGGALTPPCAHGESVAKACRARFPKPAVAHRRGQIRASPRGEAPSCHQLPQGRERGHEILGRRRLEFHPLAILGVMKTQDSRACRACRPSCLPIARKSSSRGERP